MSDDVTAQSAFQQRGFVQVHLAVLEECGINAALAYGFLERWVWIGSRTGKGAFPSHETLASQTRLSVRTVITALQDLRDKGWIEWEKTSTSNRYILTNRSERSAKFAEHGDGPAAPALQDLQGGSAKFADEVERANQSDISPLSPTETSPRGGSYTVSFEELFWKVYPKNGGSKLKAFKAWDKLKQADRSAAVNALPAWLECDQWRRGIIPHASTWLNEKRWEVDPPAAVPMNGGAPEKKSRAEEIMEAAARVQARHDERDRNRANGSPHRIGIWSQDEASGDAAGTVPGGVDSSASGHPIDAVWRERT